MVQTIRVSQWLLLITALFCILAPNRVAKLLPYLVGGGTVCLGGPSIADRSRSRKKMQRRRTLPMQGAASFPIPASRTPLPHACIRMLGGTEISLLHTELLTALTLLIAGAIPNIAGIGPTEAGFFLMFNPLLGNAMTASSLLLFRIAAYYFPFLVSVIVFLIVQTRWISKSSSKEVQ